MEQPTSGEDPQGGGAGRCTAVASPETAPGVVTTRAPAHSGAHIEQSVRPGTRFLWRPGQYQPESADPGGARCARHRPVPRRESGVCVSHSGWSSPGGPTDRRIPDHTRGEQVDKQRPSSVSIYHPASRRSDDGRRDLDAVAALPWTGWQPSCGLGGSFAVDWVATFLWIGWQKSVEYAVQLFLDQKCHAHSFSGVVEVQEFYDTLDRFEQVFLSELEMTIHESYDVRQTQ
jgi:hypothetical protein